MAGEHCTEFLSICGGHSWYCDVTGKVWDWLPGAGYHMINIILLSPSDHLINNQHDKLNKVHVSTEYTKQHK